ETGIQVLLVLKTSYVLSQIFTSATVWFSGGAGPVECCFQICKTPIDGREIASFHVTDPLCPTSAAVLITKTAEHLCADPKEQWVKMIINFLEKKAP
uniref:Chemokine interleukin-8-like domain-containing protein n=1 Tax=Xiphophorus couchianus TaxID=32473 RepID=A0A3B5LA33_9TELE